SSADRRSALAMPPLDLPSVVIIGEVSLQECLHSRRFTCKMQAENGLCLEQRALRNQVMLPALKEGYRTGCAELKDASPAAHLLSGRCHSRGSRWTAIRPSGSQSCSRIKSNHRNHLCWRQEGH